MVTKEMLAGENIKTPAGIELPAIAGISSLGAERKGVAVQPDAPAFKVCGIEHGNAAGRPALAVRVDMQSLLDGNTSIKHGRSHQFPPQQCGPSGDGSSPLVSSI